VQHNRAFTVTSSKTMRRGRTTAPLVSVDQQRADEQDTLLKASNPDRYDGDGKGARGRRQVQMVALRFGSSVWRPAIRPPRLARLIAALVLVPSSARAEDVGDFAIFLAMMPCLGLAAITFVAGALAQNRPGWLLLWCLVFWGPCALVPVFLFSSTRYADTRAGYVVGFTVGTIIVLAYVILTLIFIRSSRRALQEGSSRPDRRPTGHASISTLAESGTDEGAADDVTAHWSTRRAGLLGGIGLGIACALTLAGYTTYRAMQELRACAGASPAHQCGGYRAGDR
jgi:hypothetical protein